jgi:hypothetical protein
MSEESFDTLRDVLLSAEPARGLDFLIEQFRRLQKIPIGSRRG